MQQNRKEGRLRQGNGLNTDSWLKSRAQREATLTVVWSRVYVGSRTLTATDWSGAWRLDLSAFGAGRLRLDQLGRGG